MEETQNFKVSQATSPGVILKKILKERGITQTVFANEIGISKSHMSDIIHGRISISKQIAEKIGNALGPNPEFWFNMQTRYAYDIQRLDTGNAELLRANDSLAQYDSCFNINEIAKRCGFDRLNPLILHRQISRLLTEISLPGKGIEADLAGLFRKSAKTGLDERSAKTWVILAKREATHQDVKTTFDRSCKTSLCNSLRPVFSENRNVIHRVAEILSDHGIRFAVVEKIGHASIDGFSFIRDGVPAVVVSLRYNRIDSLAFTIMHELGHIFLHLSDNEDSLPNIPSESPDETLEQEANNFAQDALIPDEVWATAPSVPLNAYMIQQAYTKWAKDNGLSRWIVLGRVSQETGMYKFKEDGTRKIG